MNNKNAYAHLSIKQLDIMPDMAYNIIVERHK